MNQCKMRGLLLRWTKRLFYAIPFLAIAAALYIYSWDIASKEGLVNKPNEQRHKYDINVQEDGQPAITKETQHRFKKKSSKKPPHIIFILSDDLGFGDVGYHGSEIRTPFIDKLAMEGVRLENYYVQATCTPSRASIMSGRYQSRTGLERVIVPSEAACLPTKLPTIPESLRENGYTTHLVGKWHLGQSRRECLPLQRGFDTFLGFYSGAEDHFSHTKRRITLTMPGFVLEGFDFWEDNRVARNFKGQYSTHVFTERTEKIIANHSRSGEPMFIFLSLQAVHGPLQVPQSYVDPYEGVIEDENRKLYAGLTSCMDEGIKNLTNTLKHYGMWNDTVLIFSSDNGGDVSEGASNLPLKGRKAQFDEGGIRVVGFVASPLLSPAVRGTEYKGLIGGADWFPTMVEGIGGGRPVNNLGLDGINVWESIRSGGPSPRTEYLHVVGGNCEWSADLIGTNQRPLYGTLRWKRWKLRIGSISQKAFYRLPNTREQLNNMTRFIVLSDLENDPYETTNYADQNPLVVQQLLARLREHCRLRESFVPVVEREQSHPKYSNNIYQPWLKDGDDLEWHGLEEDRTRFLKYYIEV